MERKIKNVLVIAVILIITVIVVISFFCKEKAGWNIQEQTVENQKNQNQV